MEASNRAMRRLQRKLREEELKHFRGDEVRSREVKRARSRSFSLSHPIILPSPCVAACGRRGVARSPLRRRWPAARGPDGPAASGAFGHHGGADGRGGREQRRLRWRFEWEWERVRGGGFVDGQWFFEWVDGGRGERELLERVGRERCRLLNTLDACGSVNLTDFDCKRL